MPGKAKDIDKPLSNISPTKDNCTYNYVTIFYIDGRQYICTPGSVVTTYATYCVSI